MTTLALDGATVRSGERVLLADASLRVRTGEFVALVGPNGAGKTTLLRALLGLAPLAAGSVSVGERRVTTLDGRARAAEVAWLPQQAPPVDALSAREAVMAARYRFDESAAASRKAAERALGRVHLSSLGDAPLNRLSGGERQRVAIAGLLAQEARFLLLDEPANHLDPAHQAETYALLGALVREGAGMLCVTHDVNLLSHVGGARVVGLAAGTLRFDLDYAAPELPERLAELFGVRMVALAVGASRVIVPAPPSTPFVPPAPGAP